MPRAVLLLLLVVAVKAVLADDDVPVPDDKSSTTAGSSPADAPTTAASSVPPTAAPTTLPTAAPTALPTTPTTPPPPPPPPTAAPTTLPTTPTTPPTAAPTTLPTAAPTTLPTAAPTASPTPSIAPPRTDATSPPAATTTLNIFFVNDLRYHLFPMASETSADLCQEADVTKCSGGLPGLVDLKQANPGVWLHAGAALGDAVNVGGEDYYRLLKHGAAVEGLNLLEFGAMSVDADMFRFGQGREVTKALNGKGVLACANCNKELTETSVEAFRRIANTDAAGCDVVVIGVISTQKMRRYLPPALVSDEALAVQDALAKAKAANSKPALYVVIGEMQSGTAEQVLALPGVGVVLSSGTVTVGADVVSAVSDTKDKVRSSMPAEAAEAMNVGQLTLTLDDKCQPTNAQPAVKKSYRTAIKDATSAAAKIVAAALADLAKASLELKVNSSETLSADLEPCGYISCAVGQMAVDGVHALVNGAGQGAATAVILPAGYLKGQLPTAFNMSTLLAIAPDDPAFCRRNVTGEQLYGLLDDLFGAAQTFPQVAGLLVDRQPSEKGSRVVHVYARSAGLAMRVVARDSAVNVSVAMPCLDVQGTGAGAEDTGVFLSDGLRLAVRQPSGATAATLTLPPQVEHRVRLYVAEQSRVGCEDWLGMTIAYTLLVLGAVVMVSYQGYQLWRFRTTLSYIR